MSARRWLVKETRDCGPRDLGNVALMTLTGAPTWGWPVVEQFAHDVR